MLVVISNQRFGLVDPPPGEGLMRNASNHEHRDLSIAEVQSRILVIILNQLRLQYTRTFTYCGYGGHEHHNN